MEGKNGWLKTHNLEYLKEKYDGKEIGVLDCLKHYSYSNPGEHDDIFSNFMVSPEDCLYNFWFTYLVEISKENIDDFIKNTNMVIVDNIDDTKYIVKISNSVNTNCQIWRNRKPAVFSLAEIDNHLQWFHIKSYDNRKKLCDDYTFLIEKCSVNKVFAVVSLVPLIVMHVAYQR